jgi:hypothetical protein
VRNAVMLAPNLKFSRMEVELNLMGCIYRKMTYEDWMVKVSDNSNTVI